MNEVVYTTRLPAGCAGSTSNPLSVNAGSPATRDSVWKGQGLALLACPERSIPQRRVGEEPTLQRVESKAVGGGADVDPSPSCDDRLDTGACLHRWAGHATGKEQSVLHLELMKVLREHLQVALDVAVLSQVLAVHLE